MATISVEERLTAVEKELAQLKRQLATDKPQTTLPWWEKIAGTFAGSEEYEEAMRLGREYRESLRPKEEQETPAPTARQLLALPKAERRRILRAQAERAAVEYESDLETP